MIGYDRYGKESHGAAGVDGMNVEELGDYLSENGESKAVAKFKVQMKKLALTYHYIITKLAAKYIFMCFCVMINVKYYGTNCCMIGLLRMTQGNVPEWTKFDV